MRRGQAIIEFMIVLIFVAIISLRFVTGFSEFLGNSFGNLAHVLSINLNVGICQSECFFQRYKNGKEN